MIERRIRSGRYEYRCRREGRWYWKLASHLHRYHRETCRCVKVCNPPKPK